MNKTLFPCSSDNPPFNIPIVLLHGWSVNGQSWTSLLPWLQTMSDVIVIDMVYHSDDVELFTDELHALLPEKSILCGWSLGGMLAATIAAKYPESIRALITLSSNVQFVADKAWPLAMPESIFHQFYQAFQSEPAKTRKRFIGLITQGDNYLREQRRYLQEIILSKTEQDSLVVGLCLLCNIRNQKALATITCPALHVFGENDSLVPVASVMKMKALNDQHQFCVLENVGHMLHSPVNRIIPTIESFLQAVR